MQRMLSDLLRLQIFPLRPLWNKRLSRDWLRLMPPPDYQPGLLLDVLFASSGIEKEICQDAELLECFPKVFIPVADVEHLLALKILARDDESRPQDHADIQALLRVMSHEECIKTKALLHLISSRGYNRNRNLQALLEEVLTRKK